MILTHAKKTHLGRKGGVEIGPSFFSFWDNIGPSCMANKVELSYKYPSGQIIKEMEKEFKCLPSHTLYFPIIERV